MDKPCQQCGSTIPDAGKRRFCSTCYVARRRAHDRAKYRDKDTGPRLCSRCGAPRPTNRTKYCSDACKRSGCNAVQEADRARDAAARKALNTRGHDPASRVCLACNAPFPSKSRGNRICGRCASSVERVEVRMPHRVCAVG